MDWRITGHKRQLEFLENAMLIGRLAHGYLFAGPNGVGKKTIALKLAYELLGVEAEKFNPDLLEIDGTLGIKIEQIRELSYKLSLKPYAALYKIAIIDAAEQMTLEAANALLKVLEEPKPYTIIILVTSNPNKLPKTIISRCQKITFGPAEASASAFVENSADRSAGRPGDLPIEKKDALKKSEGYYQIFKKGEMIDRLIAVSDIAQLETDEIKTMLDDWLKNLETELRAQASKALASQISQVMLAYKYLEQNVNSKLLLTNLMLNT
ncbi:MAG: hypothetical protein A3B10_01465 [Candidatus Doudnabacteria bacterium RIFCSPLOWO2_01_FULL_44_21]|uniref:AAA+ ATPase domain-containing protein n=1 Tax=Candidatus Doudnabacteria bacterium RIFCSPLOWO2_01_FULL_44_21 TaxID=1817841 RepID=A0A1F5PXY0_9BACT|nr:MAG: hypothetical protein A3B95_04375 [Candidatus Doudnabacteria bacterium RIFCSPHIGHO2_02_FULL_43_13b]OGE94450.1 MAG: hypothetical protein A3B10_01465 [Candidatus Doudnabacteria bacterium RIFCSPLOWO2_01_FULL_44_21]